MSIDDKPALGAVRQNRSYAEEAARLKAEREADPAYAAAEELRRRHGINDHPYVERGDPPTQEELEAAWNAAARAGGYQVRPPDPEPEQPDDPIRGIIQVQAHRLVNGWDFINGVSENIEAVWGHDQDILWPKGEPCLLVGPSGVGKSTLAQQVLRAHIDGGNVLEYPVKASDGPILYLAMDRPAQIARSMARMFGPDWETRLKDRLIVWRGPLPFNIVRQPEALAVMCDEFGARTLFVDSLKDMAPKMSDEETGSQINAAFQMCIVAEVEVFGIHHQRKAQGENRKPNKLSDVYGSQMMVNGAGSVILLWGEAGDPVVELSHLKQPMETVGPLTVTHNHQIGVTTADERVDAWQAIQGCHKGVDAAYVARAMFGNPEPTRNDIEKARRRLDRLVAENKARVEPGEKGGRPSMWFPVSPLEANHGVITISGLEDKTAGQGITGTYPQVIMGESRGTENRRSENHGPNHDQSRELITVPPYKGGGPCSVGRHSNRAIEALGL